MLPVLLSRFMFTMEGRVLLRHATVIFCMNKLVTLEGRVLLGHATVFFCMNNLEGALVRRVRVGQLFGLLLIPTYVFGFGVDSTPWMGEWDDFSLWTCPFPVGDMDRPLANWGYGLPPFQLGIWTGPFPSPIVPEFTQCDAFRGYKVHLCVL